MPEHADGSWRGEGAEAHLYLTADQNRTVKAFYEAGVARRPYYDAMMREVAAANAQHGMVLVGDTGSGDIEHSLKGLDSLRRKSASQLPQYEGDIDAVLADIKDLHRYSAATEPPGYTAAAESAVQVLQERGAEFIKFKNTWDDPVYKGVNSVVTPLAQISATDQDVHEYRRDSDLQEAANTAATKDPTDIDAPIPAMTMEIKGRGFDAPCEFQLHTPGNLEVKDHLHLPYELQRSGMFERKFGERAPEYVQAADYLMASMYHGRDDVMPKDMQGLRDLTTRMKGKNEGRPDIPTPKPEVLAQVERMVYAMETLQQQPTRHRRDSNTSLYEQAVEAAQRPAVTRSNSAPVVPGQGQGQHTPPARSSGAAPAPAAHGR